MSDNVEKKKVIVEVEIQADENKIDRVEKKIDNLEKKGKRKIKRPLGDITGAGWIEYIPHSMRDAHKKRFEEQKIKSLIKDRNKRLSYSFSNNMMRAFKNAKTPLMKSYADSYFYTPNVTGLRLKPEKYSNVQNVNRGHKRIWNELRDFYQSEKEEYLFNRALKAGYYDMLFNSGNTPAENYLKKKSKKGILSKLFGTKFSTLNNEPVPRQFKNATSPISDNKVKKIEPVRIEQPKQVVIPDNTPVNIDKKTSRISNIKKSSDPFYKYRRFTEPVNIQTQNSTMASQSNMALNRVPTLYKKQYTVPDSRRERLRVVKNIRASELFEERYANMIDNTVNSLIDNRVKGIFRNRLSGLSKFFSKKRKSNSYMDSTFQKSMMYLGSAMLIQYAVMMGARLVAGTLNATANTEVSSLQGRAFRNDLIRRGGNVSQFDAATNEYSRLSGTSGFASRAKFANLFGRLRGAGIDTNQLNGKQLVQTIRGLELYTGDTPEQVDKKLFDLLSGKADKNTRKEFGVTANNNPVEILKQIHTTLANNPVASIGMDASLLKDTLNRIANAPSEMLDTVHSRFPSIFKTMGETIANFTDGFFGKLDPDVEKRWIGMFESIKQFMDKVITAESGGAVAKFLTDTVGGFFATLKQTADTVGYLYDDIANNQSLPFRAARYTVGKAFDFTNFAVKAPFRAGQWLYNVTHQDEIGPMPNPNKTYLNTAFDTSYNYNTNKPYARGYTPGGIIINATNAYTNGSNVTIDNMLNEVSY